MVDSIKTFENSLRDYLISVASDMHETEVKNQYKYNNLKVYMDIKKIRKPHFFVSVNISSACYSIEPLGKIEGSMGEDEMYVLRWASRPNILGELKKHYAYLSHSQNAISEEVVVGQAILNQKVKSKEELESELKAAADDITGAGVKNKRSKEEKDKEAEDDK